MRVDRATLAHSQGRTRTTRGLSEFQHRSCCLSLKEVGVLPVPELGEAARERPVANVHATGHWSIVRAQIRSDRKSKYLWDGIVRFAIVPGSHRNASSFNP